MNITLDNAAAVLTACAFALILLAPAGKVGKVLRLIVGGAWALLAVILVWRNLTASA